jgi:hypothetical protein
MKLFHVSDVLSVTTGRLVSNRGMTGLGQIIDFLTGDDSICTHQMPRVMRECEDGIRAQFAFLMHDSPAMAPRLADLQSRLSFEPREAERLREVVSIWVEETRLALGLPEMVPVYPLSSETYKHRDPLDEAKEVLGPNVNVVVLNK